MYRVSSHVNYFLLRIKLNVLRHYFYVTATSTSRLRIIYPARFNKFQNTTHRRRRRIRAILFTISSRIASKHIERAKMKYDAMGDNTELRDRSVLEKLLRIDKQTAHVMALDMLTAGVDTVSATF